MIRVLLAAAFVGSLFSIKSQASFTSDLFTRPGEIVPVPQLYSPGEYLLNCEKKGMRIIRVDALNDGKLRFNYFLYQGGSLRTLSYSRVKEKWQASLMLLSAIEENPVLSLSTKVIYRNFTDKESFSTGKRYTAFLSVSRPDLFSAPDHRVVFWFESRKLDLPGKPNADVIVADAVYSGYISFFTRVFFDPATKQILRVITNSSSQEESIDCSVISKI